MVMAPVAVGADGRPKPVKLWCKRGLFDTTVPAFVQQDSALSQHFERDIEELNAMMKPKALFVRWIWVPAGVLVAYSLFIIIAVSASRGSFSKWSSFCRTIGYDQCVAAILLIIVGAALLVLSILPSMLFARKAMVIDIPDMLTKLNRKYIIHGVTLALRRTSCWNRVPSDLERCVLTCADDWEIWFPCYIEVSVSVVAQAPVVVQSPPPQQPMAYQQPYQQPAPPVVVGNVV